MTYDKTNMHNVYNALRPHFPLDLGGFLNWPITCFVRFEHLTAGIAPLGALLF
jgi:hypothetical protein